MILSGSARFILLISQRKKHWCVLLENAVLCVKYLFQHVFLKLVQPILICLLENQKPTGQN